VSTSLTILPVTVISVHDGDTLHFDVPMRVLHPEMKLYDLDVRVAFVNAAELNTQNGQIARDRVKQWLSVRGGGKLIVYGREKYGRALADYAPPAETVTLSAYVMTLPGTQSLSLRQGIDGVGAKPREETSS
jgi:endonuclease YncB( thermonuclease family)